MLKDANLLKKWFGMERNNLDRKRKTSNILDDKKPEQPGNMGPLSVLGYAKTFRQTRTTDEWMKDLREGEAL